MLLALEDQADFVVVGTGAGGATAARVLSEAGHSVLMLEEGPHLRPTDRALPLGEAMGQSLRDAGTITTTGTAPIPLLLGRVVGGSTAVNSGICWRMPEPVRRTWIERHGLDALVGERLLGDAFDEIERDLGIAEVRADVRGGNAERMERGAHAIGLRGRYVQRNAPTCKGSARCLQGCPHGARMSMDASYVPRAIAAGARLHPLARARRIEIVDGEARAVAGDLLDPETHRPRGRFRVAARCAVIVAAGAIHTPVLLRRSGLGGLVGERLQLHPGAAVVGRFDDPIGMGFGATQAYEVPLRARRLKLEALSLPPELLATRLPGAGAQWQAALGELDRFAQWASIVRMRARGRVRPGWRDGVRVRYEPTSRDVENVQEGVVLLVRMMFAAGAREVYPGIAGVPEVLHDPAQADALAAASLRRRDFHLIASHHFGTACAGAEPATSVVRPDLRVHDVRRLYVMDASVFPTNLGVNPQHSIMAVTLVAAERLAAATVRAREAA